MVVINSLYNDVSRQGLGNRLFQYCWAREIAERKGYRLIGSPILGFPETYRELNGISVNRNHLYTPEATQIFDMDSIYSHDGGILICGYSQRYEYYSKYKERIKDWLKIENEDSYEFPHPEDLVVNIRLGDYISHGWDIDMKYYSKIILSESYRKAIIVCDDPSNPMLKDLVEIGCEIKDNSSYGKMKFMADFVYVKNAKKCIIANSTFSWWAAFLGSAEKIYFPCFKFPWISNPGINDVDLRVLDEERYEFIYEC